MVIKAADLTIVTGLPFETELARVLGLTRSSNPGQPQIELYSGQKGPYHLYLFEIGMQAHRLGEVSAHPDFKHSCLLCTGLAGGLAPQLPAACVVTPKRILFGEQLFKTDESMRTALAEAGATPVERMYSSSRVITDKKEKKASAETTRCQAVDMETGPVGAWAFNNRIPFAVLKSISDPASRSLPGVFDAPRSLFRWLACIPFLPGVSFRALTARKALGAVLKKALT